MFYKIREKFWAWGNDFNITDGNDKPVYFVDGKAFSRGDQLSFQDLEGNELAFIRQEFESGTLRYSILIGGEPFAEVVKDDGWFNKNFTLDLPGPNDYSIEGSMWNHEYKFSRSGQHVASVSKTAEGLTDSYRVWILDGEEDVCILCTCIIIDQIYYGEKGSGTEIIGRG